MDHKGRHPGQHQPILEPELWNKVQTRLNDQNHRDGTATTRAAPNRLIGEVFDQDGEPHTQGAAKGG